MCIKSEMWCLKQFADVISLPHLSMIQPPQLRPGAGTRTALPRLPHGAPAQRPAAAVCPWGSPTPMSSVSWSKSLASATCDPARSTLPNTSRYGSSSVLHLKQLNSKNSTLKRFPDVMSFCFLPPSARKEMSEHLQGRAALKPHHLWLHQQETVQAQVLRRLHGWALLHPVQIQNHRRGVRVSERDGIHLEDAVGPGLLLQPQLQKPQRHLLWAGELLWLPRSHELTDVIHTLSLWGHPASPLTSFSYATFGICDMYYYVQGIFLWSFFLLEKSVNMKCICVSRMDS